MLRIKSRLITPIACAFLFFAQACSRGGDNPTPAPTAFAVTGISPTSGADGTSVTITGTGFSVTPAANTVKFNGVAATVQSATATSITVIAPPGAGTGAVSVTLNGQTAMGPVFNYTVVPLTVTGINPATGAFNTSVTITGTGFGSTAANNIVKFNGVSAIVQSATSVSMVVTVPAKAGTGTVTVSQNGQAATAMGPVFNYVYTATVSTFAGNGTAGFADGAATSAAFRAPVGVVVDASGNVYVADAGNNRIRKITPAGVVSTFAGNGTTGFADGPAANARFNAPFGLALDAAENLYVVDQGNSRIRKITPAGIVTTFAGSATQGFADGPAASAQFHSPVGVAVDAAGNVFVADWLNYRIRKINTAGIVTTYAGNGTQSFADGAAASAAFVAPSGLALDAGGNLYVSDEGSNRIRKITPAGVVSTLAGNGIEGFADGSAASAEFEGPVGMVVDTAGNVYTGEGGGINNDRIRIITPAGFVNTVAGIGTRGFADGPGSSAKFDDPIGLAMDVAGNIYVADEFNNRIRKITIQ